MRFNGPAPETINGRLAMIGFVAGAMNEFTTSTPLEEQVEPLGTVRALLVGRHHVARHVTTRCAGFAGPAFGHYRCKCPFPSYGVELTMRGNRRYL